MIIDTCLFMNEIDTLKIRVDQLMEYCDKMFVCEFPITFRGKMRNLVFPSLERDKFLSKFIESGRLVFVTSDIKNIQESLGNKIKVPHEVESYQRRYLWELVKPMLKSNDTVIHGDVDEIPNDDAIKSFFDDRLKCAVIETKLYRYFYNLYFQNWLHLFIAQGSILSDISDLKKLRGKYVNKEWRRIKGGWHFSSVGNLDLIMEKLNSFRGSRDWKKLGLLDRDRIEKRIKERLHPFKDGKSKGVVRSVDEMPSFIRRNPEMFKELML